MKSYKPVYYDKFHCIAEKCKHNCCIGWEIDIDETTIEKYKQINGSLGEKLKKNIVENDGVFSFSLKEDERCPFLLKNNLCQIITEKDETFLCDICREHPRFYNFFSARTEYGLGICCEEAAKIIINSDSPFSLSEIFDDDDTHEENNEFEDYVLFIRDECLNILEDEAVPLSERTENLLSFCEAEKTYRTGKELFDIYSSLERLDISWNSKLEMLKRSSACRLQNDKNYSRCFKNLAQYFVYRHLSAAVYDGRISERARLVFFSVIVIEAICQSVKNTAGSLSADDIADIARAYSAEIEYSENNIEALLKML